MLIPYTMHGESQALLKAPPVQLIWVADTHRAKGKDVQHAKSGT